MTDGTSWLPEHGRPSDGGLKLGLVLMPPFGARWKAEEIEPTLGAWPEAKSFVATFSADYAKVNSVRVAVDFIIAQRPKLGV
ncbi:hypothetical protein [Sorangium sp. So ce124]|uniref:hypothetical protein n=1 Tax=Sorangium sp. So ce124 TaxID=3133280 RepID=UPI003F606C32